MKRLFSLFSLVLIVSIICGCGESGGKRLSTQSPTPVVTHTQSPTPVVTHTQSPTPVVTHTQSPTPVVTHTQSPTPEVTPTPLPTPKVKVLSGDISRIVATGTSVVIKVLIQPEFTHTGNVYAKAIDKAGIFMPNVSVTANSDGTYKLELATSTMATTGHYVDSVTLDFFSDEAYTASQKMSSVTVPFDINVMSSTSSWPGDNLSTLSAWPGVPDWAMFQGNAAHTGYVPVVVDPNKFSTRWEMPAVIGTQTYYKLPATLTTYGGKFFVAGDNNLLYARKEYDGSLVWQYDFSGLPNPSTNPPAVVDNVVYIAAGRSWSTFLFAFNAADGSLIFKAPMSSQGEQYLAPTIGTQGIYTNAGYTGGLYAFDRFGHQLFFANMGQTSLWTPAVDTMGVYTYPGGALLVVDPKSSSVLYSIKDPKYENYTGAICGSPVLGAPGSIFVANYVNDVNTLINFNLNDNAIAWQIPGAYTSTPAYADSILYAVNENPLRLEAHAEADGTMLWSWQPQLAGDTDFISEVLLTKNLVFVSTNQATYGIDITTHRAVWSYPLSGRLALSQNGILYLQGEKSLVAINLNSEKTSTPPILPTGSVQPIGGTSNGSTVTITPAPTLSVISVAKPEWQWQNPLPQGNDLYDVWGSSSSDVFVVGGGGTILHYDGSEWTAMTSGTLNDLAGVWGSSSTDVFAVGWQGTILHFNGSAWRTMTSGTTMNLTGVWGSSSTDVFAVGGIPQQKGTILHYDGNSWSSTITSCLTSIWGSSSSDVFAVGNGRTIFHYDGSNWEAMDSSVPDYTSFQDVWGSSSSDVFVACGNGGFLHYDGKTWSIIPSSTNRWITSIWGSSSSDVFAVGSFNTILHYNGSAWSTVMTDDFSIDSFRGIWSSSPSDIFVVGNEGTVLHYNGSIWSTWSTLLPKGNTNYLNCVWGSSSSNFFTVGVKGTILHYDGREWAAMNSSTLNNLTGIWGSSSSDVFAVGDSGTILHYDGNAWSAMNSSTGIYLNAVWGSSSSDVFAVGSSSTILHYDGHDWKIVDKVTPYYLDLWDVWGSSSTDVFVIGKIGTILHYNGNVWNTMNSGAPGLDGIWGSSSSDVFAVGTYGFISHYNGSTWSTILPMVTINSLHGIWGSSSSDIFVVGSGGTILHYDGSAWSTRLTGGFSKGELQSVWGSSSSDVFVVGNGGAILHFGGE